MRLLLVEDNIQLGDAIKLALTQHQFTVDWITDGAQAQHAILNDQFDCIVLDLGLPNIDGISILKHVRERKCQTPILILSARDTIDDQVKGLDIGADCYLTKPFDVELLVARIHALLRRPQERQDNELKHGNITLNPKAFTFTIDNTPVSLSRREFNIVQKLLENIGRVITRDQLSQAIYGWSDDVDSNTIEVHIHNIRKKCAHHLAIRTIRGVGYLIEPLS
ncbi:MAG: response regulator [Candidatus Comchoanobacterales bacterium]